jgi:mannose-6-phosphate isomerase-like protein (cupin superfamily)
MGTKKHLVLEDDVYLQLRKRKARTSLSVKTIGNAVLRSGLSHSLLTDMIGRKLVEAKKITKADFSQAVEAAISELTNTVHSFAKIIRKTNDNSFVSGSWEFKESFVPKDKSFQVWQCWARDSKKKPMPCHVHDATEFAVILAGKAQIMLEEAMHVLGPGESICILPEHIHSTGPLTEDTRMLVITTPRILNLSDGQQ